MICQNLKTYESYISSQLVLGVYIKIMRWIEHSLFNFLLHIRVHIATFITQYEIFYFCCYSILHHISYIQLGLLFNSLWVDKYKQIVKVLFVQSWVQFLEITIDMLCLKITWQVLSNIPSMWLWHLSIFHHKHERAYLWLMLTSSFVFGTIGGWCGQR